MLEEGFATTRIEVVVVDMADEKLDKSAARLEEQDIVVFKLVALLNCR